VKRKRRQCRVKNEECSLYRDSDTTVHPAFIRVYLRSRIDVLKRF
jgi:hypothetical protein